MFPFTFTQIHISVWWSLYDSLFTISYFVFSDTTLERNALMEKVYPKLKSNLREYYGLEFQVRTIRLLKFLSLNTVHIVLVWVVSLAGQLILKITSTLGIVTLNKFMYFRLHCSCL